MWGNEVIHNLLLWFRFICFLGSGVLWTLLLNGESGAAVNKQINKFTQYILFSPGLAAFLWYVVCLYVRKDICSFSMIPYEVFKVGKMKWLFVIQMTPKLKRNEDCMSPQDLSKFLILWPLTKVASRHCIFRGGKVLPHKWGNEREWLKALYSVPLQGSWLKEETPLLRKSVNLKKKTTVCCISGKLSNLGWAEIDCFKVGSFRILQTPSL